jgi:hypothetical protein
MKKGITYFFLIVYATVMLKPLVPYISDFVAHVFWSYEHISTVHFEHGKYHTHYESLEAAKKENPEKNGGASKSITSVPEHIISEEEYIFRIQPNDTSYLLAALSFTEQAYHHDNFRPPKA